MAYMKLVQERLRLWRWVLLGLFLESLLFTDMVKKGLEQWP